MQRELRATVSGKFAAGLLAAAGFVGYSIGDGIGYRRAERNYGEQSATNERLHQEEISKVKASLRDAYSGLPIKPLGTVSKKDGKHRVYFRVSRTAEFGKDSIMSAPVESIENKDGEYRLIKLDGIGENFQVNRGAEIKIIPKGVDTEGNTNEMEINTSDDIIYIIGPPTKLVIPKTK